MLSERCIPRRLLPKSDPDGGSSLDDMVGRQDRSGAIVDSDDEASTRKTPRLHAYDIQPRRFACGLRPKVDLVTEDKQDRQNICDAKHNRALRHHCPDIIPPYWSNVSFERLFVDRCNIAFQHRSDRTKALHSPVLTSVNE